MGSGLSTLAVFGFIAFLVWHGSREKFEKRRLRMEEQSRILDRIGSGPELVEFLRTEEGKRFLSQLDEQEDDKPRGHGFRMGIIGLVTAGVIVGCLTTAFFVLAEFFDDQFYIPAVILAGVGVALILAAGVQYLFGRKWGLLETDRKAPQPRRTLE